MGVRSRAKRRRTAATSAGAGGAADLISALVDDILVRILELLPEARDAVRTGALSRRWRGLWTRIPALRFSSDSWPEFRAPSDARRYVAMVDDALAHRAAQTEPAAERLAMSLDMTPVRARRRSDPLAPLFFFLAAQRWIRHAARHGTRSLALELRFPRRFSRHEPGKHELSLDSLPTSTKLETLRLALGGAVVQLPATAVLKSLTELSLERMEISEDGGRLLARLVSSACCPRLQKLRLHNLRFGIETKELVLEAGELLELSWKDVRGPWRTLELSTPNLRLLRMEYCWVETLRISAPRLENLVFLDQPDRIHIDSELPCVGSLKVELHSHGSDHDDDTNDDNIHLLQCCTKARCLEVSLCVSKDQYKVVDIVKGRIPHLPHVTSLKVHVDYSWELHSFGDGVASLLRECSNLRYLCLQLRFTELEHFSELESFCNRPGHLKSHGISLPHLQELKFKKLAGINCELWFVQSVLSSATELQQAAISFNKRYWPKNRRDIVDLLPVLDCGKWTTCRGTYLSYKWRRRM
ncbi:hypothetical protein ACP70R_009687 [Stipagrostis hirtigluma subsp. patula]